MQIVVGTENPAKVASIQLALAKLSKTNQVFEDATVTGCKVDSRVASQPLSESETMQGSINRARCALQCYPNATYAIGVESGIETINGLHFEAGWVSVIDTHVVDPK